MSVMLAISGPRNMKGFEVPPIVDFALSGVGVIYTIASSVALTIVAYGLYWRRKGYRFFDQPGHWILVEVAVRQLLYLIPVLIDRGLSIYEEQRVGSASLPGVLLRLAIFPTLAIVMVIVNIYIGRTKCHDSYSARVFYAKAATFVPIIGDLAVLVLLDRAVRADRRQRGGLDRGLNQRGFVQPIIAPIRPGQSQAAHWYGVVVQFTLSGLTFVMLIGFLVWLYSRILSR